MGRRLDWRGIGLSIAFVILAVALLSGTFAALQALHVAFHDKSPVEKPIGIVGTWLTFVLSLLATWIMARMERRSWLDFGLRGGPRGARHFGQGLAVGLVSMIAIACVIHGAGGMTIRPANLTPGAIGLGLLWAIGFFGTGLFEETIFRGYLLKRLDEATPFPTAIVVTSLLFGLAHLTSGFDAGLALVDAMLIGAILAISIRLTGSLWWAIGFHAAWDFGESFGLGAPDSGLRLQGALFRADPAGPVWLSGGGSGPEGSVVTFAVGVIVLVWLIRRLRHLV